MTTDQIITLAMQGGFPALVCWYLLSRIGPLVEKLTVVMVRVEKTLDRLGVAAENEAAPSEVTDRPTVPLKLTKSKLG